MSDFITICEQAARAGGKVLIDWSGQLGVREKGPDDLVTEADFASQEAIQGVLLDAFPDHGMLGEEGAAIRGKDPQFRWIVDPLDGTLNYVHRVPNWCVSVAFEDRGQIVAGTVYDPLSEECYTAKAGGGAYLNGQPLRTSGTTELSDALMAASFPPRVRRDSPEVARFIDVLEACQGVRRMGSAALNLCYLAAGRFDGYWSANTHAWDIAAGMLLIREAQGVFTDLEGNEIDLENPHFLAAATPELHAQLLEVLRLDGQ